MSARHSHPRRLSRRAVPAFGSGLALAAFALGVAPQASASPEHFKNAAPPTRVTLLSAAEAGNADVFDTFRNGMQLALETDRETLAIASHRTGILKLALNDSGGNIAVVFPDIGEPYRSVFAQIVEGIEDKSRNRVITISVATNTNMLEIANELRKHDVKVVIALGRHGINAANAFDRDVSVVAGAIVGAPENDSRLTSIHSLAPDPGLLFARLKTLTPDIKRVHAVFDPRQNGWLMRLAREAAATHSLELVPYEVSDLKGAIKAYQDIIGSADPRRDAIWLPQDATSVDENAVLPYLLQECWNRSLTMFSSNVSHVKRGALFSLYPNNVELGRNLATSALALIGNANATRGMTPLRSVFLAVNVRTAGHLGLTVNPRQNRIDMVFPTQ